MWYTIQLENDGQIKRKIYGNNQNVATLLGLVEVMRQEVGVLASSIPGAPRSRETRLLSGFVATIAEVMKLLVKICDKLEIKTKHSLNSLSTV